MENNYTGIIYKATNLITLESYIGATEKSIEDRQYDHYNKALNNAGRDFQSALFLYGTEMFEWTQLAVAESPNELAEKEIIFIKEYNSVKKGYNLDKGGGIKKLVYRYDLEGNFDKTFETLSDAGSSIGVRKQDISRACWSVKKKLGNYLWSYDLQDRLIPEKDSKLKTVHQFDLEGNFISEYESASEASRLTGISKTCISRCCRGERAKTGNFFWRYL